MTTGKYFRFTTYSNKLKQNTDVCFKTKPFRYIKKININLT